MDVFRSVSERGFAMKTDKVILITKDALNRSYLHTYGNSGCNTPNIDELAEKGTVFMKHYTGAPSTIMSNMCMFTGLYPHESELKYYEFSKMHFQGKTLFDKLEDRGYSCHIIWDDAWLTQFKAADRYYCYGKKTKFHYLKDLRQGVGAHYLHKESLENDENKTNYVYRSIVEEIEKICALDNKKLFVWLHIPHVINGRVGYGTDIDAFDQIVGLMRKYFPDDGIYISADHGNMNGIKGKVCYGHDVYEPNVLIPLITPRLGGKCTVQRITVNVDLDKILIDDSIPERGFVYSDTAFYGQPNRKLAILDDNYKYIYNKFSNTEELYDLRSDTHEDCNMISDLIYDSDRCAVTPLCELYPYQHWKELPKVRLKFREEKNKIWRNASVLEEFIARVKYIVIKKWIAPYKKKREKKALEKAQNGA